MVGQRLGAEQKSSLLLPVGKPEAAVVLSFVTSYGLLIA